MMDVKETEADKADNECKGSNGRKSEENNVTVESGVILVDKIDVKNFNTYSTNFARYFQFSEEDQKKLTFSSYYDIDKTSDTHDSKPSIEFPNYTRVFALPSRWNQKLHRDDRRTACVTPGGFCEEEKRRAVPIVSSSVYGRQVMGPLEPYSQAHTRNVLITGPGGGNG